MRPLRAAALLVSCFLVLSSSRLEAGADLWTGNGPQGASFLCVATTPANPALVFAIDFGGAFLRSTDGGATWNRMTSGLPSRVAPPGRAPQAAAIAPSDAATAYLASQDSAGTIGIYKTTDGGMSWAATGSTAVNDAGPILVLIHPSNAQIVWVGTFGGIFRTTDGGASWTQASGYSGRVNGLAVDPSNPANVYAAVQDANQRVVKSTDAGMTFNDANVGLPGFPVEAVAVDPAAPLTVFVGLGSPGVLYKSTDAGGLWSPAAMGIDPNATVFSILAVPGPSACLLAGTTQGLYRSLDGGATWIEVDPSLDPNFFRGLARDFASAGGSYAASATGLVRLPAGSFALLPISSSSLGLKYWGWVVRGDPASASTFYAGTPAGLFLTTDDGQSWTDASGDLPDHNVVSLLVIPRIPQSILIAGTTQTIWRSSDGGATWTATSALILNAAQLVSDPVTPGKAWAATQGGLFVSTNFGQTWSPTSTNGIGGQGVYRSAVDPKTPTTIYAGSGHGEDGDGLYKSIDDGLTWTQTPLGFGYIWALAVAPQTPTTIYAAGFVGLTSGGRTYDLWKSTDGGATWGRISIPGASGFLINELVADPLATSTVWAAIDNGLYRSTDGGASWATVNQGLPADPIVQSFQTSPGDSKTYLAGNLNGGGAFSLRSNPTGPLISEGGTFDTPASIGALTPVGGATVAFSSLSVSGSGGSAAVSVGTPAAGLRVATVASAAASDGEALFPCTPVERRNRYDVSASILIPAGQAANGSGRVEVNWYSDFFCNSLLSSDTSHPVADPTSRWKTVSLDELSPPKRAVRTRIGLFVTKHQTGGAFTVNFDDVAFNEVCDSPTATLQGTGIVTGGQTATLSVALTGLAPWTLAWSDGFVQTGITTSPAERVVSPVHTTRYEVRQLTDVFCSADGSDNGGANTATLR